MHYVLDLPWGMQYPGVQYWKDRKVHVLKTNILPAELRPFAAEDFSYHRWQEDELNGLVTPPKRGSAVFTPRDHQKEGARAIYNAYARGWSGMLVADYTGTGKTLTSLVGITAIAKKRGFDSENKAKVLIVCPKGVIPQWRNTLRNYPVSAQLLRPLVINYQQLGKLLQPPANARAAKKARTKNKLTARKGKPKVDWDFIIFDEAHYLKNYPSSTMSMEAANIAGLEKKYRKDHSPFVVYSTATPGSSPLNFALMSPWLAQLITCRKDTSVHPSGWGDFLEKQGFAVKKGKTGYTWAPMPWGSSGKSAGEHNSAVNAVKEKQRRDARRIGQALTRKGAPFIMRSPVHIADWPEQQYIPYPIELTGRQRNVYEEVWSQFRSFLRLPPAKRDPKTALVENLRYRQKSSLLKVDALAEMIEDFVESGHQVYVSCEFTETIDKLAEALRKKKIASVEISGRNVHEREDARIAFQKGDAKVVLCTVVAGISLHAGEILPDGTKATSAPRITIIANVRANPNDTVQSLGRAHRDGVNSIAYFPYLEDTVDEKVIASFTNKFANMGMMTGSTEEDAEFMERLFDEAAHS